MASPQTPGTTSGTEDAPAAAKQLVVPLAQWSGSRVIFTSALGSMVITLCFFAPRFWLWPAAGLPLSEFMAIQPEFHRAFHALRQLQDPWMRVDDAMNRVIEWRLFWPVVAHALGLPGEFISRCRMRVVSRP